VVSVLHSDLITQGPVVDSFEQDFAQYIGSEYAVAVANGTAALHLSAMALDIGAGQTVITTPLTFAASANCVLYTGGHIQFVDIDPETLCMDLNQVEDVLKKSEGDAYTGVIPVDFAGYPVDLESLKAIADKFGLWILEDACHAPGGYFKDSGGTIQRCGNGRFADLAIFSFHPVKHITTGEGGMITTNDRDKYERLKRLRTHGITKDPELLLEDHGGWYYELQELGYNYRLTDFQSVLGISQLKRAEAGLQKRKDIAARYSTAFKNMPEIIIPKLSGQVSHAFHLYVIQVKERKRLYDFLRKQNIFTQVHYVPVHLQPFYRSLGWKKGDFPHVEDYYERCLSLPMFPTLTEEEQDYVITKIKEFFG